MDKMISDLQRLVEIESVSMRTEDREYPFGKGVRAALDTALEICGTYGFRTKNCDNMTGFAEVGEGEELMGILVHLDVVPAGDGWRYEPFPLLSKMVRSSPRRHGRQRTSYGGNPCHQGTAGGGIYFP